MFGKFYKLDYTTKFVYLFIISFAVCISVAFNEDNKNLILIGTLGLSPLIILRYPNLYKVDVFLILFILSIFLFPLVIYPDSTRWSTVIYSGLFSLSFLAYSRLLNHSHFTLRNFEQLLRGLLYAYFIVLILQQIGVLTGLPIINERFYSLAEPWKLNSLGAEPSWSARIIGLLMYCFITVRALLLRRAYNIKVDGRTDKWTWFMFFYSMVTLGSATALLFLFLILTNISKVRNLFFLAFLLIPIIIFLSSLELNSVARISRTVSSTITLNEEAIVKADHSASFRIVPIIVLAKEFSLATTEDWFGHGVDAVINKIDLKVPGMENMAGGGLLSLSYEYGFLSFLLFILFSLYVVLDKSNLYGTFILWFFLVFSYSLNVQIPWLAIILLYTIKFFKKNASITLINE